MTNESPLVDADLITERDFVFPLGGKGDPEAPILTDNDSKESVLELCFSSYEYSL